jgi:hypothetical protein
MRAPQGSVNGLCSASAAIFSLGMAFLGFWGFTEAGRWALVDKFVAALALIGFASLGLVSWIVTTPVEREGQEKIVPARWAFAVGVAAIWLAVLLSFFH